ncbi:MAG TPA: hypothetical protein VE198_16455 [Actinoallomurus sp.]|nr:hypothetical protein [Actinoallomurus sp.]
MFEAAEHKIGGFSLDLIGRDQDTDEWVIIENQFGPTDHRHLGRLLTYQQEPCRQPSCGSPSRDETSIGPRSIAEHQD